MESNGERSGNCYMQSPYYSWNTNSCTWLIQIEANGECQEINKKCKTQIADCIYMTVNIIFLIF